MNKDNIKEYIVSINSGSGVIFQPADINYSYILTAKHIFDDISSYDSVKITHYNAISSNGQELTPFSLTKGVNYYPHPCKDIAILKINRINNSNKLIRMDSINSENVYSLYGFPDLRRTQTSFLDQIREDPNLEIGLEKSGGKREGKLPDNSIWGELVGTSGGGIFCIKDDYFWLVGIQNKIPVENEFQGRIEFSPIINFDEIVELNTKDLEPLLPCHVKCFSYLKSLIFDLSGGLLSQTTVLNTVQVLKKISDIIIESKVTPYSIIHALDQNNILLTEQDSTVLSSEKIWVKWYELLTIIRILEDTKYPIENLELLFTQLRLFYSDINEDFWIRHLKDLSKSNYSNLEKNGLVIVASNIPAKDNLHELKSIPENISRPIKDEFDLDYIGIDQSEEYPFHKFRFKNISVFKEHIIVDHYNEFENLTIPDILTKLREFYGQIISK